MKKLQLPNVTLIGIDCVDAQRLIEVMDISQNHIDFGSVKLLTSRETDDTIKISIPHIATIE